ncbi:hypothetical protein ACIQVO_03550 [Streptomyces sp. NPDC101062]|uniref:hypothetical protein n=1 Tax=unclassified Streptomyces TaxID=2593676 RepID=UPI002E7693DB|nr:hypothetical protein [Streptomyces sp. JV176]MEE1802013.1 hypothetical protein [Streptomyces sp. JV176]
MRPECTEGAGGGLLVPMAWMYAEYIADELLRTGDLMPPTTLEYRAGRDALALTIFLSDGSVGGPRVVARMEEWRSLTAYGTSWRDWVCGRLDLLEAADFESASEVRDPDLALAGDAWRWLEETELLAPDLDAVAPPRGSALRPGGSAAEPAPECTGEFPGEEEGPRVWTPAWQLGLPLGHLAIHLF